MKLYLNAGIVTLYILVSCLVKLAVLHIYDCVNIIFCLEFPNRNLAATLYFVMSSIADTVPRARRSTPKRSNIRNAEADQDESSEVK
jgi:hypothetical protein